MSPLPDRRSFPAQSRRSVVGCWLLFLLLLHACPGGNSGGPVYVDGADLQAAAQQLSLVTAQSSDFLTQTVYGFLDFTTTIGNTVMVFSPQTVPPDDGNKATKPTSVVANAATVIETKPSTQSTNVEIKPSRTVAGTENKDTAQKKAPSIKVNVVEGKSSVVLSSKVEVVAGPAGVAKETKVDLDEKKSHVSVLSSRVDVIGPSNIKPATPQQTPPQVFSSVVEIHSSDDREEPTVLLLGNNIGDPEYDFLSRQPSEFVEETYKVVNLKPSSKFHLKPRASHDVKTRVNAPSSQQQHRPGNAGHPTGLVTKLGGTVVKDGATTVHETSVIGTYISGKYAQVLQSTSHIFQNHGGKPKPTPASSSSLRILKTAAPVLGGKSHTKHGHLLDPTPAGTLHEETAALPLEALFSSVQSSNLIRPSRRPSILSAPGGGGGNFKNRFRNRAANNNSQRDVVESREQNIDDESDELQEQEVVPPPHHAANTYKKSPKLRPTQSLRSPYKGAITAATNNKFGRTTSGVELATVSVFSDHRPFASSSSAAAAAGRRHYKSSSRRGSAGGQHTTAAEPSYTRRGYKPRLQTSAVEPTAVDVGSAGASTSLYKFKLNRQPGRWQYKTTPKPRVTIRKQNDADDDLTLDTSTQSNAAGYLRDVAPISNDVAAPQARSDESGDLELSGSSAAGLANYDDENTTDNKIDQPLPMETIKIEISTPADFKDVYYEIATIKSPYTFQVGSVKNTRYITVTSTIEKNLIEATESPSSIGATEPLTENILATASHYNEKENNNNNNVFETSVATLPPIVLASDVATPPLETLTETFSTTQEMLKTHILPVFRDGHNSTMYTLVQTYRVTRLVTATKTLPPMEAYHFVPSKTLNEFNSRLDEAGTELHLELEFGDDRDDDRDAENTPKRIVLSDLDLAKIGSDFDLSDVDKTKFPDAHLRLKKAPGPSTTPKPREEVPSAAPPTPALSPEQLQQLALLRFLNPAAQVPQQVVTTSKPIVRLETVYESHVIPIIAGASTTFSTISRPIATVAKTEYELATSTITIVPPAVNPLFAQQQQQQQQLQQFAVTSTPVVAQTVVTQTDSKVLKLTFGAKTAYTTLYSTRVVPTLLTTYMTASVPVVQPTAFPGFFPAPYAPFPYVG